MSPRRSPRRRSRSLLLIPLLSFSGCLLGCQGSGDKGAITLQDTMSVLKDAAFVGEFSFSSSGTPLQVFASTHWGLGPELVVMINGTVDFKEKPGGTEP